METGINVDSLESYIKNYEKKDLVKKEQLISKIVEYNFFIQNEIEISRIIDKNIPYYKKYGFFRFFTVQDYNIVKLGRTNENSSEKLVDKKYLLLKYKDISDSNDNIIDFFINEDNNKLPLIWNLFNFYEYFLKNISFLSENNILITDFSVKNLLYDSKNSCIYLRNFEKCCIKSKLFENWNGVNQFISILETIEYFGNKHFDLYFAKQILIKKDLMIILNNLNIIIEDYINNLYYMRFFPENIKNEITVKWKKHIKNYLIFEKSQINSEIIESNNWKSYLHIFLENSHIKTNIWETFSMNSLFLNISISFLKFLDIEQKNSILHQYVQFLFNNLDITKPINIDINEKKFDFFMNSIEDNYKLTYKLTFEKQEGLYNYLVNNINLF